MGDTGTVEFQLVADNLRESFRAIASSRSGGELRELRGVSIASAGVTFQMFNTAFLSGPVATEAELKKRILEPIEHFDSRGQEWAYWVCEDWIDPLARKRSRRVFENHGLRLSTELPGMPVSRCGTRSSSISIPTSPRLPISQVEQVRPAAPMS